MIKLFGSLLVTKTKTQNFKCQEEPISAFFLPHKKIVIIVSRNLIESVDVVKGDRKILFPAQQPIQGGATQNNVNSVVSNITTLASNTPCHICATFLPEYQFLITGDEDAKLRVYDIHSAKLVFTSSEKAVPTSLSASASPASPIIEASSTTSTLNEEQMFEPQPSVVPPTPAEEMLAQSLKIIENAQTLPGLTPVRTLQCTGPNKFVTGESNGVIRLWQIDENGALQHLKMYPLRPTPSLSSVNAMTYDEFRQRVAVGCQDGKIRQYDLRTGQKVLELGLQNSPQISAIASVGRPDFLVFSNDSKTIRVWDLADEKQSDYFNNIGSTAMVYVPSTDTLFSATEDGDVIVFKSIIFEKPAAGSSTTTAAPPASPAKSGLIEDLDRKLLQVKKQKLHKQRIRNLYYQEDSDTLVTCSADKSVTLWNDCYKTILDELEPKDKAQISRDIDIQFKNLPEQQILSIFNEMKTGTQVFPTTVTSMEKTSKEKLYCFTTFQVLLTYDETEASKFHEKLSALIQQQEMQIQETKQYIEVNKESLLQKYSKFIDSELQPATGLLAQIQQKYEKLLSETREKHQKELEAIQKKFAEEQKKCVEDHKREVQRVAKTYQSIKNTCIKRLEKIDVDVSKQLRDLIQGLQLCNDKACAEFEDITNNYRILCPVVKESQQTPIKQETSPSSASSRLGELVPKVAGLLVPSPIPLPFQNQQQQQPQITSPLVKVYKAIDFVNCMPIAIKVLPPGIHLMDTLNESKGLVPVREIIYADLYTYVIMDLMPFNLRTLVKNKQQELIPKAQVLSWVNSMLQTLDYLASLGLVHRDLRPENVLLTKEFQPKLFHVGIMKALEEDEQHEDGTVFSAPELLGCSVAIQSDIWSLGCIFAYLLQTPEERKNYPIFPYKNRDLLATLKIILQQTCPSMEDLGKFCDTHVKREQEKKIFQEACKNYSESREHLVNDIGSPQNENVNYLLSVLKMKISNIDEDCADLLLKMLQFSPWKRISAKEALSHKCLSSL